MQQNSTLSRNKTKPKTNKKENKINQMKIKEGTNTRITIILDMSFRRAMSRTKSQGTCRIDHSLIMTPSQYFVFVAKRCTIDSIVNIGEETAICKR